MIKSKDFASFCKEVMKEQKIEPQELADIAMVSVHCVNSFLNDRNSPTTRNLVKIIDALGFEICLKEKDIGI